MEFKDIALCQELQLNEELYGPTVPRIIHGVHIENYPDWTANHVSVPSKVYPRTPVIVIGLHPEQAIAVTPKGFVFPIFQNEASQWVPRES
jgi:hypothetical protein